MKKFNLIRWAVCDSDGTDLSLHYCKEQAKSELSRCKENYEGKFRIVKVRVKEVR